MQERRYISDLHFFDEDVMLYMDRRPFSSVEEMNEYMVKNWNDTVEKGDEVIVLGDMFSIKGASIKEINRVLHRLKGRMALIIGNHDAEWMKKPGIDLARFSWIETQKTVKDRGREVILNHYPILFFGKNHTRDKEGKLSTYMLHGHVHSSPEAGLLYSFQRQAAGTALNFSTGEERAVCNCINCFCGYSDYKPLTLNEWEEKLKKIVRPDGLTLI